MTDDDAARRAMHVILDMVASQDINASTEINVTAAETAFASLDPDAIVVTIDDEGDMVRVDPTILLAAAGTIIISLLDQTAKRHDQDRLTVLNVLREHLDEVLRD